MAHILVANVMVDGDLAHSFQGALERPVRKYGVEATFLRPHERFDRSLPLSHLIISGSEGSTIVGQPWDVWLENITDWFMAAKKPILGICYGHQFLAKHLFGTSCINRSATPEFGWKEIIIHSNPLFDGMTEPLCMVSHYDHVARIHTQMSVIAATPACRVQAFQQKNLPVWGVQFHPEYDLAEGDQIFSILSEKDCLIEKTLSRQVSDRTRLDQNDLIFRNFFSIQK